MLAGAAFLRAMKGGHAEDGWGIREGALLQGDCTAPRASLFLLALSRRAV